MPGNAKPNRSRSARGEWIQKYRAVRDEYTDFKKKTAKYQEAVHELAVSATKSARRVGMLTQTVLALRKHFAAEPHLEDCEKALEEAHGTEETLPEPCTCGHDAILESVDKALAEPDFEPEVHVEIKDPVVEAVNASVTTDPLDVAVL